MLFEFIINWCAVNCTCVHNCVRTTIARHFCFKEKGNNNKKMKYRTKRRSPQLGLLVIAASALRNARQNNKTMNLLVALCLASSGQSKEDEEKGRGNKCLFYSPNSPSSPSGPPNAFFFVVEKCFFLLLLLLPFARFVVCVCVVTRPCLAPSDLFSPFRFSSWKKTNDGTTTNNRHFSSSFTSTTARQGTEQILLNFDLIII